ncbi:MAG: cupin domain-containing protein [Nitriliruptorales bacterium]|nr:cupin domain-containing protein [Nitriliruptorales bacterium]
MTADATTVGNELDLFQQVRENDDFRRVLITGPHLQIVAMTIPPGGEIGAETHPDTDQVLLFLEGEAESILDGERTTVGPGQLVFVEAGTHHNFVNTGTAPLRLATAYAPPEHEHGTVHATKAESDAEHDH